MSKQNKRRRPDTPPPSPPSAPPHYMMCLDDGQSSRPDAPSPVRRHFHPHHYGTTAPRDIDSDPPPRYEEAISEGHNPSDPCTRPVLASSANQMNPTHHDSQRRQRDPLSLPSSSTLQRQPNSTSPAQRRGQRQQPGPPGNQSEPPGCSQQSGSRHSRQADSLSDASGEDSPSGSGRSLANNQNNPRYRSASPSGLSTESQDRSASTNGGKAKKNRSSKIKKGLESIAFFIIQLLD